MTYYYFVTLHNESAYRVPIRITKKQRPLGLFTIMDLPQVYTPEGWAPSNRYKPNDEGEGGIASFTASIDSGVVRRLPLIQACAAVNADVLLFAPTQSSRIASKKLT